MMKPYLMTAALALAAAAPAALAQAETEGTTQAVRTDLWVGSDADGNEARKLALGWDVDHRDIEHWWGVKVEHARFSGRGWRDDQDRVFVSGAGDTSKRARMLEVGVETPRWKDAWLRLDAGYTDTPVLTDTGTDSYSYRYLRLQAFVAF